MRSKEVCLCLGGQVGGGGKGILVKEEDGVVENVGVTGMAGDGGTVDGRGFVNRDVFSCNVCCLMLAARVGSCS